MDEYIEKELAKSKSRAKLIADWKLLKNDTARWLFIKENQGKGIMINLDNDDTFGTFEDDENSFIFQFDNYVGWSDGVMELLLAMGIEADCV